MSKNRHKSEQIIAKLRDVEVELANRKPVAAASGGSGNRNAKR